MQRILQLILQKMEDRKKERSKPIDITKCPLVISEDLYITEEGREYCLKRIEEGRRRLAQEKAEKP